LGVAEKDFRGGHTPPPKVIGGGARPRGCPQWAATLLFYFCFIFYLKKKQIFIFYIY